MTTNIIGKIQLSDYSLVGKDSVLAIEKGLAEATWYASPVPKAKMRELLERRDGPALRDTLLWFCLLGFFGLCGYALWGSGWAIIPFAIYGVLYASTSDSRWHESGHGTAFKTDWMNNALYEIASFMVLRESTSWRWSHTRHHSDTIIVGRDPEIAVPRPPDLKAMILTFFNVGRLPKYVTTLYTHCIGHLTPEELTYIPESEHAKVIFRARIYALIYAGVITLSLSTGSLLPLMFIGLPNLYGAWLMVVYGYTQHAGLAENVLDHRLNCRTVYMNPINRFLYLNMNYHLEHHMFPLVPYHTLPKLHALIKADLPTPYHGLLEAYREIIPAMLPPGQGSGLPRQAQAAHAHQPAEMHRKPPGDHGRGQAGGGWLDRGLRQQPAAKSGCHPFRPRKQHLRHLPHGRRQAVRHRRPLHARQRAPGRRHGEGHADRVRQAQWPFRHARRHPPSAAPVCVALKTYAVRSARQALFRSEIGGRIWVCGTGHYVQLPRGQQSATWPPSSRNWCWSRSALRRP